MDLMDLMLENDCFRRKQLEIQKNLTHYLNHDKLTWIKI